ncbi:MAG: phosphoribosylanthranilate isomerase [Aquabacterium sp.]|nr:MAG: phosphoribosylanthranilate isomerase [Aquabacterium sp.]
MPVLSKPVRTRIKICGLSRESELEAAVLAGADAVGFVMYDKSPRHVSLDRAAELAALLPPFVTPTLLFVNAPADDIARACDRIPNALLQFHGDETREQCDAAGRPYLRAARMGENFDLLDFALRFSGGGSRARSGAQALLLDAYMQGYGGGGKVFDWSLIPPGVSLPVVLSGGLTPENVIDGITQVRPWAVDVSSGVEQSKGVKDVRLIHRFCDAVREADARLASPDV